jgi:hypothetical protein
MEKCPTWKNIYKIFVNEGFPMEYEDLIVYQNIKKSGIYDFAVSPMLFPYNDTLRWVSSHLDTDTTIVFNEIKVTITSLKLDDIHTIYHM